MTLEPIINSFEELLERKKSLWKKQVSEDVRLQEVVTNVSKEAYKNFYLNIILNPYIPVVPFYQQVKLLLSTGNVFYGGARGGGKSEACLMGALQYVAYPAWKVGVFRLTYSDLSVPGAIMSRALEWMNMNYLGGLSPRWDGTTKTLTFPSGSKVMFGHVQHEKDAGKYQGSEFHLLIFDEAVQFSLSKLTRIQASKRKKSDDHLPLNTWYTGNPGGLSHEYFKKSFVEGDGLFIESNYLDNPFLDHERYEEVFQDIKDNDPILYRQWKYGDWNALPEGQLFKREWLTNNTYERLNEDIITVLRFWDLAATYEGDAGKSGGADWTVGALLLKGVSGRVYLEDVVRFRLDPDMAEERIIKTSLDDAERFGRSIYKVRVEQEGGASAKYLIHSFSRALAGLDFDGSHIPRKSKVERARAHIGFIKHGNLKFKDASWLLDFVNELASFPTQGIHDDQVDSLTGGLNELLKFKGFLNIDPSIRGSAV